jgi:hypothetical protein
MTATFPSSRPISTASSAPMEPAQYLAAAVAPPAPGSFASFAPVEGFVGLSG